MFSGAFVLLLISLVPQQWPSQLSERRRITAEERAALIALYESTNGPQWIRRNGWLGPEGTECDWYGVVCQIDLTATVPLRLTVKHLELHTNGLVGRVSPEAAALPNLETLQLEGNYIPAPLPDGFLKRFDRRELTIEPLHLIHDLEELLVESDNPSILCVTPDFPITEMSSARIRADGSIELLRRLCRMRNNRSTRVVYCERRQGETRLFHHLARFVVGNGFFEGPKLPDQHWIDVGETVIRAKRNGREYVIHQGSPTLSRWALELILDRVLATAEWSEDAKEASCPPRGADSVKPLAGSESVRQ